MQDTTVGLIGDEDTAMLIGMSVATVWRMAREGRLPAPIRIRGRTLWRRDEVIAWIQRETDAYRAGRRPQKTARTPRSPGRRPRARVMLTTAETAQRLASVFAAVPTRSEPGVQS